MVTSTAFWTPTCGGEPREFGSRATLSAGRLRVTFAWRGDRFGHTLDVLDAGVWQAALVSLEGTPDEDWPASPPFQSLHVESRPDEVTVALLVGMAGKSHWSASIEFDSRAGSVRFDVACRVRDAGTAQLGSVYQTLGPGCQLIDDREVASQFEIDGARKGVRPLFSGVGPATIRWAYCVRAEG